MSDEKYNKTVKASVTVFLKCENEYLFIKRSMERKVDPGLLNGIGGKLETGENYVDACIRETFEETGYKLEIEKIKLGGIVRLESEPGVGYVNDWIMNFFVVEVESKEIPNGNFNEEGELVWIKESELFEGKLDWVDDLNYCLKEIIYNEGIVFLNATTDASCKVTTHSKIILKQ